MTPTAAHKLTHRFSVAPMMDCTDRHYRYLARLISRRTRLYTEMVTAPAIVRGKDPARFLSFDPMEAPLTLQLGGSDPAELAKAAQRGQDFGYDEINLNVGCPSDRVQSGRFGACLMAEPALVADCIKAMRDAVNIPVTVKHRIGIDRIEDYGFMRDFVGALMEAGCTTFIVHARNAWLKGLSPKENREVPPLRYDLVHRLKQELPQLTIILNGGLTEVAAIDAALEQVDGVMVGREAYHNPWFLSQIDTRWYGDTAPVRTRQDVALAMLAYAGQQGARGVHLRAIVRHMLGLYLGQPGARAWRRLLSDARELADAGPDLIARALTLVEPIGRVA